MYHPNRRYGNPAALRALTAGLSIKEVARLLHRHPRTVKDWITERRPMPYWVAELLELRHQAALASLRQMGIRLKPSAQHQRPENQRGREDKQPAHHAPEARHVGGY